LSTGKKMANISLTSKYLSSDEIERYPKGSRRSNPYSILLGMENLSGTRIDFRWRSGKSN